MSNSFNYQKMDRKRREQRMRRRYVEDLQSYFNEKKIRQKLRDERKRLAQAFIEWRKTHE